MSVTASSIVFILPTHRQLDYARRCVSSFFRYTSQGRVIVVDDATPGWHTRWLAGAARSGHVTVTHYPERGGLTRSWNRGFDLADSASKARDELWVAGNSDVLFTPDWWRPIWAGLQTALDFVGPLTNAPGRTDPERRQNVQSYCPDYRLTDNPAYLETLARRLQQKYGTTVVAAPINGFFMAARRKSWLLCAHAPGLCFPPRIQRMPSGRRNRTPLMTGQEDWLRHRCAQMNLRMGVALGSFIFHYRAVSRGRAYLADGWFRAREA